MSSKNDVIFETIAVTSHWRLLQLKISFPETILVDTNPHAKFAVSVFFSLVQ